MSDRYPERVRDLLDDARSRAAAGDWEAVRDLASAALALAPHSEDARGLLRDASSAAPVMGERRQLTVMFCDMVGSTALTQDHDPEILREVLRSYQAACDEAIRRYEGHIARYVGDGVLAYFGHPVAHEDDARRAVQAGLDLLDALEPVTDEARSRYGIDVRIRVAVHTGLVVRAEMGSPSTPDPDAIVGETPNLAARLQEVADPGTVVISDATLELVRGWFLVAPLPPARLRGIDREIAVFRVIDQQAAVSRLSARADLTPFVGRTEELDRLLALWAEVRSGAPRVVVLVGDAGVGKSRLADVARRRIEADDGATLTTGCSSYQTTTPLYAARRLIEGAAGIDLRNDGPQALPKLWTAMDAVGQGDGLPLMAELLGLPPEPWCPAPELDGAVLRERILATLVDWLLAVTDRSPLLVLVEDVQWADATTLELLGRIVGRGIPGLLLVLTARDGFETPWRAAEVVPVDRLGEHELRELATRLPEARSIDDESLEELIERSDGVPLFLEELVRTRAVTASEPGGRTAENVPAALRDLLLARFAAPGVDLRLAQLLATIGNEVSTQLASAVSGLPDQDLERQLDRLVETGTLVRQPEGASYRFRHHLLADLAYDTQLNAAKESAHSAVADALLAGRSGAVALDAGALAHHLEHGGRPAEAIDALVAAAEGAQATGALSEASAQLDHAMSLLDRVPDPDLRVHLEIEVRQLRGMGAAASLGYAAPVAIADFEACRALIAATDPDGYLDDDLEAGDKSLIGRAWSTAGFWATLILRGRLDDAEEVSLGAMRQLRPGGPHHQYFDANRGMIDFFRGDYALAGERIARTLVLLEELDPPRRLSVPSDLVSVPLSHLAMVRSMRCDLSGAADLLDQALEHTDGLPFPQRPFSRCYAEAMRGAFLLALERTAEVHDVAATLQEMGERHGFLFWSMLGGLVEAMAAHQDGDADAGPRAETSIMMLRAMDVLMWQPSWLATVGASYLRNGALDDAARLLDGSAAAAEQFGGRYWAAETARLRHAVEVARGAPPDLMALRGAADLAAQQGATLFEVRARADAVRLGGDAPDRAALAALLAGVDHPVVPPEVDEARALLASTA